MNSIAKLISIADICERLILAMILGYILLNYTIMLYFITVSIKFIIIIIIYTNAQEGLHAMSFYGNFRLNY